MSLPPNRSLPVRRRALGFCAEGPGFYVWDEDPREVARLARELARQPAPVVPEPVLPIPGGARRRRRS